MKKEKFGKVAIGQVQQSKVITSTDLTGVSNRVAVLEGYNLDARLDALEAQMATMLTHKHNYDDGGIAEQTSTPV